MPRKLGQSPCPSGSRKPRIAKEQPAVAGIRAYLPAALVVGRISIRPRETLDGLGNPSYRQRPYLVNALIPHPLAQFLDQFLATDVC